MAQSVVFAMKALGLEFSYLGSTQKAGPGSPPLKSQCWRRHRQEDDSGVY